MLNFGFIFLFGRSKMKGLYCAWLLFLLLQLQLVANSRSSDDLNNKSRSQLDRRQLKEQVSSVMADDVPPPFSRATIEHRPSKQEIEEAKNDYQQQQQQQQRDGKNMPPQFFNAHSYRTSPPLADKREQPYPPLEPVEQSVVKATVGVL